MVDVLLAIEAIEDDDERDYIGQMYEQYSKRVKSYARTILGNNEDAEDALGITFLKIIKYRNKFIGIDERLIKGRILLITRCTCYDMLVKRDGISVVSVTDAVEDDEGQINDLEIADGIDILDEMVRKETVDQLYQAVSMLKSPAKEIVMLKYFDDTPNVVIADLLNMNESTVGTILQRSLKKLKKALKED